MTFWISESKDDFKIISFCQLSTQINGSIIEHINLALCSHWYHGVEIYSLILSGVDTNIILRTVLGEIAQPINALGCFFAC